MRYFLAALVCLFATNASAVSITMYSGLFGAGTKISENHYRADKFVIGSPPFATKAIELFVAGDASQPYPAYSYNFKVGGGISGGQTISGFYHNQTDSSISCSGQPSCGISNTYYFSPSVTGYYEVEIDYFAQYEYCVESECKTGIDELRSQLTVTLSGFAVSAVPLPAAFPIFAIGLLLLGVAKYRSESKPFVE
ncbi:MAG: hypothetical protein ABJN40_13205 [Sneathiella sp.]